MTVKFLGMEIFRIYQRLAHLRQNFLWHCWREDSK